MPLLNNIEQLKTYVSVNANVRMESVQPYINQAERKYIKEITGEDMYNEYVDAAPAGGNAQKVYTLLLEASANLAWFIYLPLANVQISEQGIATAEGQHSKAAEWWQVRDLRRSFAEIGFGALDEALKIMEANEADFASWKSSEAYTVFSEFFVKRTDTFNKWFNIGNSRRTFLALRPFLRDAHHRYFTPQLNAATLATINFTAKPLNTMSLELSGQVPYQVLELVQASQVNYAMALAIHSGLFEITETGIYIKLEDFPGFKGKSLNEPQIHRVYQERLVNGQEYFKKAISIIAANPDHFPDYAAPEQSETVTVCPTKSVLGV